MESLSELYSHPEYQELEGENELLRSEMSSEQLARAALKSAENITIPYTLKNRLVMNEGKHNGLVYTKSELKKELSSVEEEFNLICDHLDTRQGAGVANYAGAVLKRKWLDSGKEGPGVYADLEIRHETLAKQLALGAKFGVSPTYDYDPVELEGEEVATNLSTVSYSLVLDPAVRKTMLNEKQKRGVVTMENKEDLLQKKKKKYPYKFPEAGAKGKKELPQGPEMDAILNKEIEVDEDALSLLQAMGAKLSKLQEFKDGIDKAELTSRAENIVANEFLMGRLEEDELDERREKLLEKSTEVLEEVEGIVGDHVLLSKWTDFIKAFRKKTPGASFKEIAKAFKKKKGSLDDDPPKPDEPDKPSGEGTSPEQQLGQLVGNTQEGKDKSKAELSKQSQLAQRVGVKVDGMGRSELDNKFAELLFGGGK